jgi:hypothetical protein
MFTSTFLLLLIALLVCGAALGAYFLRKASPQEVKPTLSKILLAGSTMLLLLHFALEPAYTLQLSQPWWAALHLLAPFVLGFLAFLFSQIFAATHQTASPAENQPEQLEVALPWLSVAMVGLLAAFLLQPYGLLASLLLGALLLMSFSLISRPGDAFRIGLVCLVLLLLGLVSSGMLEPMLAGLPGWVGLLLRPILFILAGLVALLAAIFAYQGMAGESYLKPQSGTESGTPDPFFAALRLGLAIALILMLLATVFWVSVWDRTADGLGGIWFVLTGGMGAIAAGGFLVERYRKQIRFLGFIFLLLVPVLIGGAFAVGIEYPYLDQTEKRAATIQRAVEQFNARHGNYPTALEELVPRDLVWVPPQLILRGENWCYQGGQDYYRLGVFWRLSFSSMLMIEEYARAGSPPDAGWICLENLERMKWKYDPSPFFDGGQ